MINYYVPVNLFFFCCGKKKMLSLNILIVLSLYKFFLYGHVFFCTRN